MLENQGNSNNQCSVTALQSGSAHVSIASRIRIALFTSVSADLCYTFFSGYPGDSERIPMSFALTHLRNESLGYFTESYRCAHMVMARTQEQNESIPF